MNSKLRIPLCWKGLLASGLSQIIWRVSADGNHFTSPRWADLAGVAEHRLDRDGWLTTLHPADYEPTRAAWREAFAHHRLFKAEFRLRQRDATYHWFRGRAEPVHDARGHVIAWIGMAANIEDQKRAESALVESEARLRAILDAARVGTIDYDLCKNRLRCSPLAAELIGLSADAELSLDLIEHQIHPDDLGGFRAALDRGMAPLGNGAVEVFYRARRLDGSYRWTTTRGSYLHEGVGTHRRATRFIGVRADVDDHVRELEERARLSEIVSSSEDAIIATTPSGAVTHWNPAAERLLGYGATEMVHQSIARTIPPELIDEERALIAQVASGDRVCGRISDRVAKSGKRVRVSVTHSAIVSPSGACVGVSTILRDVSAQLRMEAELREAQKMEAVSQLASGVVHDLNNMMTAILAGLELAERCPGLDAASREMLHDLHQACFSGGDLIRQLNTLAGRHRVGPQRVPLSQLVTEIVPIVERMAGASITLVTNLDATGDVFVDPGELQQAILNIALNARDAMEHRESGGILAITTTDEPNEQVSVSISDTGCGMSPEIQARVFDPFSRRSSRDSARGSVCPRRTES